jgi:hypothetical protein
VSCDFKRGVWDLINPSASSRNSFCSTKRRS